MRGITSLIVVSLIAGCGPTASAGPSPSPIGAPCPLTTPPPIAMTPPPTAGAGPNAGLQFRADAGSFLYGNDALFALLPRDGTLHPDDRGLPAGSVKFPWYRIAHGDLSIATRRLDDSATPLPADVSGGYGDTGFLASGLRFPSAGCWQVTGTVDGKTLTFVVNVAAR